MEKTFLWVWGTETLLSFLQIKARWECLWKTLDLCRPVLGKRISPRGGSGTYAPLTASLWGADQCRYAVRKWRKCPVPRWKLLGFVTGKVKHMRPAALCAKPLTASTRTCGYGGLFYWLSTQLQASCRRGCFPLKCDKQVKTWDRSSMTDTRLASAGKDWMMFSMDQAGSFGQDRKNNPEAWMKRWCDSSSGAK